MPTRMGVVLVAAALVALAGPAAPVPLTRAHAHNDYLHARPLFDALDHGFCSVEADVWLVDGKLLVAHDRDKVKSDATLQSLYLHPLRERARMHQGRIYQNGPPFTLLIDVKSDAEPTYAALREVLRPYADVLTVFQTNATDTKAVTVIISGNRARAVMAQETLRYAAYDGRLQDLDSSAPASFIAWISSDWTQSFRWWGDGPMPDEQRTRLRQIVDKAHQRDRRVRFWATPESTALWRELLAAGVDVINTDDLVGLERFLRQQ
jgi:glycerophosphoryl diester phosphodiesterase